jgi:hypothetical protein
MVLPSVLAAVVGVTVACSSSTSPSDLTGKYVGTYAMDSVTTPALAQAFPPNGTLDSASGVAGTLILKSDSFYVRLVSTNPGFPSNSDSGGFSISGSGTWTFSGTLFSGSGTGALVGNQLQINLTGGQALGSLYGVFNKE